MVKTTKLLKIPCTDCGEEIQIVCSETIDIITIRCPPCFKKYNFTVELREKKHGRVVYSSEE